MKYTCNTVLINVISTLTKKKQMQNIIVQLETQLSGVHIFVFLFPTQ